MIFVPEVRPFGDLLQGGLGLLFLKFGRDHETQADRLGVRYAIAAGYDPRQMAAFFDVLDRMRDEGAAFFRRGFRRIQTRRTGSRASWNGRGKARSTRPISKSAAMVSSSRLKE
jgi:hypothetical protein